MTFSDYLRVVRLNDIELNDNQVRECYDAGIDTVSIKRVVPVGGSIADSLSELRDI